MPSCRLNVHENKFADELLGHRDSAACRWTLARVQAGLDAFVGKGTIVVLANREPIRHHALAQALNMPEAEQATRMRAMRAVVAEFNAYRWVGDLLMDAAFARVDREHHQHQWHRGH
jgi:hypothetical protein